MKKKWDKFSTIAVVSALMIFSGFIIHKYGFVNLGPILALAGVFVIYVNAAIAHKERKRASKE